VYRRNLLAIAALLCSSTAFAHHSYAMFDNRKSVVAEGTIAKFEWTNPHSFVWMYVKKANKAGEYDLFAFECDTPNELKANGWSKDSLKAGDKVSIRYFPLRDGRSGGRLIWVQRGDGTLLQVEKNSPGVAQELQRLEKEKAASSPGQHSGSGK
jgi:hypothetical protein